MSIEKKPVYKLRLSIRADKYLLRLDAKNHKKILDGLETLKTNPYGARGVKPMKGFAQSRYRLRIGNYRAVYDIDKEGYVIIVLFIGPRGDVYK
jgi:mRNA interferase RelE/StbE